MTEREDNEVKGTGEVMGGIRNSEAKVHKKKGKIGSYGATAEGVYNRSNVGGSKKGEVREKKRYVVRVVLKKRFGMTVIERVIDEMS